jgi:hypothetical protein
LSQSGRRKSVSVLVAADQHLGLRQHQLAEGIEVALLLVLLDPGQVRHVGDQRHVGVVGQDLGDRADALGRAEEADLPAAIVTSSRMLRACSAITSASIGWWSKTSWVSRITMLVTTGSPCAPIAAIVAMSPAMPPAPLGSLALKLITQAGAACSCAASPSAPGSGWGECVQRSSGDLVA